MELRAQKARIRVPIKAALGLPFWLVSLLGFVPASGVEVAFAIASGAASGETPAVATELAAEAGASAAASAG